MYGRGGALAGEAESQESEAAPRSSWRGDVLYPRIALVAAVGVALVPWLIRPSAEQPDGLVTAYVLVGPLLAVGLLTIAAFRLSSLRNDADRRNGGAAGATVAFAGLLVWSWLSWFRPRRLNWRVAGQLG